MSLSGSDNQPRILVVDDDTSRHEPLQEALADMAEVTVLIPEDVDDQDIDGVHLISVDDGLGPEWEQWLVGEDGPSAVSARAADGLAVAAAFRSQARRRSLRYAVSLHTAALNTLGADIARCQREPLLAAQHDLDWVFAFEQPDLGLRMFSLAHAVASAGEAATTLGASFGAEWLGLPLHQPWTEEARGLLDASRPPAHGLARNTQGRSFVRWLAQRVLPYPTFLLDAPHSANLLGITEASFAEMLPHLPFEMASSAYAGPLSGFMGVRWWKPAWQALLESSGVSLWDEPEVRAQALSTQLGLTLEPLTAYNPVVAYDEDGAVVSIDVEARDAVRLQADGWPAWADDPWATLDEVRAKSGLRQLVAQGDRPRVEAERAQRSDAGTDRAGGAW